MVDDLRIEEAVQEALGASAKAKAMALVQLATDPKGCKQRIADLTAATKKGSSCRSGLRSEPVDFGKFIADETEKWGKIIRAANIKPE
jgi:hypothetical protein